MGHRHFTPRGVPCPTSRRHPAHPQAHPPVRLPVPHRPGGARRRDGRRPRTASDPGSPPPPPGYPPPWAQVPVYKPGIIALRPLRLGDVYDGAFKAIRQNPKTMVGLAALVTTAFMLIPALVSLFLAAGDSLLVVPELSDPAGPGGAPTSTDGMGLTIAQGVGGLFALPATVVLTGICVHVVHRAALGRRTTIGEAWGAARGRLLRLLGLTVLGGLAVAAPLALLVALGVFLGLTVSTGLGVAVGLLGGLAGLVVFLFLQVRLLYLAPAALMLERRGVMSALGRAWNLSRGQYWRLFGIWLLTGLVVGVASQVIAIPFGIIGMVAVFAAPDSSSGRAAPGPQRLRLDGHRRGRDDPVQRRRLGPALPRPADPEGRVRRRAHRRLRAQCALTRTRHGPGWSPSSRSRSTTRASWNVSSTGSAASGTG